MNLNKLIDGLKAHKIGAASYESVDEAIQVFEAIRDVDGEKVVKGLECCLHNDHKNCPYDRDDLKNTVCMTEMLDDANALIRQQQERIAELEQNCCRNIEALSNRERDIRLYILTRINTLEQDRVNLLHYLGNVAEKDEEDLESDRNKRDGNAEKL